MEEIETGLGETVATVERLAREGENAKTQTVVIGGDTYARPGLVHMPPKRPEEWVPPTLALTTLQGLIDYIRDQPDEAVAHSATKRFVLIESPTVVSYLRGAVAPGNHRVTLARATADVPNLSWGSKWGIEDFITVLRTHFVLTDNVKHLIDVFSRIDASNAITLSDDGLSQQITVNRGVRGKEGVALKNPLILQPLRTFSKVTQPESPFLIRLHSGALGEMPTVSLRDADLGQWKLAAVENVKAHLVDALPGVPVYG